MRLRGALLQRVLISVGPDRIAQSMIVLEADRVRRHPLPITPKPAALPLPQARDRVATSDFAFSTNAASGIAPRS